MADTYLVTELIKQKRNGETLKTGEIQFLIDGYTRGRIPDYQMSSLLMAIYFRGMNEEESHALTEAMLHSGKVIDFSFLKQFKVDKHSTGGVGDKTSLILAPIVAACGLCVPMISGRGLGHTGGTLDKLESIPGFSTQIDEKTFLDLVKRHGLGLIGQTQEICPADKKIYALRDVTATVESLPLICASIMSKKIAEGIDGLVLDVKFGSGAFMPDIKKAEELALALKSVGERAQKKVAALLTSMEQPLGRKIGNAFEVEECLEILRGEDRGRYEDTKSLSLELSAMMIWMGRAAPTLEVAREMAEKTLSSGKAFEKFEEIVVAQGGELSRLPKAKMRLDVLAEKSGFITEFNTRAIGNAGIVLGAGRKVASDKVDPVAGIELHKKLGDRVERGEPIFSVVGNDSQFFEEASKRLLTSARIDAAPGSISPLIAKRILPSS